MSSVVLDANHAGGYRLNRKLTGRFPAPRLEGAGERRRRRRAPEVHQPRAERRAVGERAVVAASPAPGSRRARRNRAAQRRLHPVPQSAPSSSKPHLSNAVPQPLV